MKWTNLLTSLFACLGSDVRPLREVDAPHSSLLKVNLAGYGGCREVRVASACALRLPQRCVIDRLTRGFALVC